MTGRCNQCGEIGPRGKCECGGRRGVSGKSGHKRTKFDDGAFVAFDGEGTTDRGGKHYYNLLACSDGTYIERYGGPKGQLSSRAIFDYLLEAGERHKGSIFVMFSGWYDVNMWLGDASRDNIAELWAKRDDDTNYTALFHDLMHRTCYEVSLLPKKYYKIRFCSNSPAFISTGRTTPEGKPEYRRNVLKEICIWDVFGFFQSSFVKALAAYNISAPQDIAEMKGKRGTFSEDDRGSIRDYCISECTLLVTLMDKLRDALRSANLRVKRWDGAGAVAASLMAREKVREHMQVSPDPVFEAARGAMAGGRIECTRYGVIDQKVYGYDINSAYPAVYPQLPSLAGGTWEYTEDGTYGDYALCYVSWEFDDADILYPYHYRDIRGNISYPSLGQGWQWSPLVATAQRLRSGNTKVHCAWSFRPATDTKPFGFVRKLFEERKRLKREGNAAEKAIKLGINSLYGKTAQQKGARKAQDGTTIPPPYFQLEWAGYVTASVRAKLYETAMQNADQILFIATDGIVSLSPLQVSEGSALGQWEAYEAEKAVIAQSGVYWLLKGNEWVHHYRGFDADTISRSSVETALAEGLETITAKQTRFVTMGRALAGSETWSEWRRWVTKDKLLRLTPSGTKRELVGPNRGIRRTRAHVPAEAAIGTPSELFPIEWLDGIPAEMQAAWAEKQLASSDVTE